MSTIEEVRPVDEERLMAFVFRAVEEVGATLSAALVVMGDKLGLYRALAGAGPVSATALAEQADVSRRYVREWLNAQAAGGFVEYDPAGNRYSLAPEQAVALTDTESAAYLPGFFQTAIGSSARLAPDHRGRAQRRRRRLARARTRTFVSKGASSSSAPATNANHADLREQLPALDERRQAEAGCDRWPTSAAAMELRRS